LYLRDSSSKFGILGPRLAELHARLPLEPVYHQRLLSSAENERLADLIASIAPAGKQSVQVLSFPTWLESALLLRKRLGWPIIYDCHDLIGGFRNVAPELVDEEKRVLEEADFVFFSSQKLFELGMAEDRSILNKSIILRNATTPIPMARRKKGGIIGYIGSLDDWFDIDAIRSCAKRFPDRKIQLIGRGEYEPIRVLRHCPNVEFTGEVEFEKLPEYMAEFDVGLIPFQVTPLTLATNPIKLYEYFSLGMPVVSSRLPEVEAFKDL